MHGSFNLAPFSVIVVVTAILVIGIKESANFNSAIVIIKVAIVLTFIAIAVGFILEHPDSRRANWHPFIPPNTGAFGTLRLVRNRRGAAVIFFAYIGFDAVSTAAQEAKNPQRDMPIGILGSLVICTILYILVSGASYGNGAVHRNSNVPDPVAVGMDRTGVAGAVSLVKLGAIAGLGSVMLVMLLGQSRVFYSMSRDGLLPQWAGAVHPRFRTPWISSITVGIFVAIFASLIPIGILGELVSIGTLLAFVIVCAGVWILRVRRPELHRPFKTPWVPLVPIMGILVAGLMMVSLPRGYWAAADYMARDRYGDLLRLRTPSQPRTGGITRAQGINLCVETRIAASHGDVATAPALSGPPPSPGGVVRSAPTVPSANS